MFRCLHEVERLACPVLSEKLACPVPSERLACPVLSEGKNVQFYQKG